VQQPPAPSTSTMSAVSATRATTGVAARGRAARSWRPSRSVAAAAAAGSPADTTSGIISFQPAFTDGAVQQAAPSKDTSLSLARMHFDESCEAAINEQINVEYSASYLYHSLSAYFNRDNVALPGLAKFFKAASDEERDHAQLLMDYQAKRGGKVVLSGLAPPLSATDDLAAAGPGDALRAAELALAVEKLTNEKLLQLHAAASAAEDPALCDFVEGELLSEQVDAVYEASEMVSKLRRIGPNGHGVWAFDQELAA